MKDGERGKERERERDDILLIHSQAQCLICFALNDFEICLCTSQFSTI